MRHTPTSPPVDRDRLVAVLQRLRDDGTLTAAQVSSVLAQLELPATGGSTSSRGGRFVEAAAYAGGVLVVASGLLLLVPLWEDFDRRELVTLLAGVATALAIVGAALSALRPRGRAALLQPPHGTRRRIAGTVLTAAAAAATATAALLLPSVELQAAGLTAVLLMTVVCAVAPSVVTEAALLVALLLLTDAVFTEVVLSESGAAWGVVPFAVVGGAWAAVARTRALTAPVPATVLGLTVVLVSGVAGSSSHQQPETAIGLTILILLAVGGLAGYVRGAAWPSAAAGVCALAAVVLRISSDSLGPAVGVMLSGVLLLVLALGLVLLRRAQSEPTG